MILLVLNYDIAVKSSENEKPDNNCVILAKLGQILLIKLMQGESQLAADANWRGRKLPR